jgi:chemotaxis protein CheY-P-specific phosphatase CheC
MSKPLDGKLRDVAEKTLESMAFLLANPEGDADAAGPRANVVIGFAGAFNGQLNVTVHKAVLPELAANMLGLEDGASAPEEQQVDALKELTNVLLGNLLPAAAGTAAEFNVGVPAEVEVFPIADEMDCMAEAVVFLDAGNLWLSFHADSGAPVLA